MNQTLIVQLMIFITFLTPLTTAITQLIKISFPKIPTRFQTVLAVFVAIALASVAWAFTDLNTTLRLWAGLFAGLSAAKVYDVTKNLANAVKK